jgi:hypothetical protein
MYKSVFYPLCSLCVRGLHGVGWGGRLRAQSDRARFELSVLDVRAGMLRRDSHSPQSRSRCSFSSWCQQLRTSRRTHAGRGTGRRRLNVGSQAPREARQEAQAGIARVPSHPPTASHASLFVWHLITSAAICAVRRANAQLAANQPLPAAEQAGECACQAGEPQVAPRATGSWMGLRCQLILI